MEEKQLRILTNSIDKLTKSVAGIKEALQDVCENVILPNINDLEEALPSKHQMIAGLQEAKKDLKEQIKVLEKEKEDMRNSFPNFSDSYGLHIDDLENQITHIDSVIETLATEIIKEEKGGVDGIE
ncbi:MAG: hypothetical protein Q4E88_02840 [Coriobacteriia bacterium]|nr:hypothetical protein [Coriobacteriia bacterium]